ncbi:UDP-glucose 4-epimerase [Halovenus aranensis]|uniref:UDP-glucose 4-epimerase n=1 Tax=Halovenus aranensis TaxID=890420 RepID=A0A1G8VVE8_9EURY|nr:UDP-glucose 4-epimerase [Halovenus aranensis]
MRTVAQAVADTDVVFYEAALVSVGASVRDPIRSHTTNTTGTLNILEAAREHDTRVVFASSAAIYGHPMETPIDEAH